MNFQGALLSGQWSSYLCREMWYNNILETIGNTPLVRLNKVVKDIPGRGADKG